MSISTEVKLLCNFPNQSFLAKMARKLQRLLATRGWYMPTIVDLQLVINICFASAKVLDGLTLAKWELFPIESGAWRRRIQDSGSAEKMGKWEKWMEREWSPVIKSFSHPVIQSSSHSVIRSSNHPVIQSSSKKIKNQKSKNQNPSTAVKNTIY